MAVVGKVANTRRLSFPALKHRRMRPSVCPHQPAASVPFAPHGCEAEQVIEAAAVDTDIDHFAARYQVLQRPAVLGGLLLPVVGTSPAIRQQRQTDLDVEVLGQEAPERLLTIQLGLCIPAFNERLINRQP
ncbi:hypothetical protein D3C81_1773980 [compost metagenome]